MKPPRLFLKIFLWFWSTVIVAAFSSALTFVLTRPRGPGWHWRWVAALAGSALVCYLLAKHLTDPVFQLRRAARELAKGNLQARAQGMDSRSDELGDLVRDFNAMAARLDELVARQRQLIYDISHELRSPLARINVALDLARERKGEDASFEHMERDIGRLDEMIGRLLTIARLDAAATPLAKSAVDLSEIVAQVVHDAKLEAQGKKVELALTADTACWVEGDAELLSSAVENVVRNAVHYTEAASTVQVILQKVRDGRVTMAVRDAGPGVPPAELSKILLPFYRTANARDRKSGGAGLGLAITERVMRAHGGTVVARNVEPHGLEIAMALPAAEERGSGG